MLLLLVHFEAIFLAVELVTVSLNQPYSYFLSLAHSISPTPARLPPSIFLENLFYFVVKSCYKPLTIIIQKFFQKCKMTIARFIAVNQVKTLLLVCNLRTVSSKDL